jgi:hypothetical protein
MCLYKVITTLSSPALALGLLIMGDTALAPLSATRTCRDVIYGAVRVTPDWFGPLFVVASTY